MADNFKIKTPHAAVLIWNYVDRIGTEGMNSSPQSSGVQQLDNVEPTIISTLSCVSIQTSKSKGQPEGTFQIVLAPTKDWVSTLTPGSWLCILMSNNPITQNDLKKANKTQVKMIGKIESVRAEVTTADDGARQTRFYVAGVDWGHIFNNIVYVDNLIASKDDPTSQGNAVAVALRNLMFGNGGTPKTFYVKDNLRSLINIFGQNLQGFEKDGSDINRLAGALYNFRMPKAMVEFFDFVGPGGRTRDVRLNKILNLITGSLKKPDLYVDSKESKGFIDPFSLQGQHTFWQVLIENSNPVLNEMFPEMRWNMTNDSDNTLQLAVYNRIKPFSYQGFDPAGGGGAGPKSYFQNCRLHTLDDFEVISLNAGTNWRDKFNFIEVKPNFQDFNVISNWYKQKSQAFDQRAFEREGFRPLILETKQFPSAGSKPGNSTDINVDWDQLQKWVIMMRERYFNTHRMLNGTVTIHGTTEYIGVGDNIRFNAGLVNVTPNLNSKIADGQTNDNQFVLAHVENVSHSFSVTQEGARNYITTIQFVRGILVNGQNKVAGEGPLDKLADKVTVGHREANTKNVISSSDKSDPDSQKLKGT
jgi:hypothetical protein